MGLINMIRVVKDGKMKDYKYPSFFLIRSFLFLRENIKLSILKQFKR